VGSISGLDETYRWWSAQSGLETLTINGVPAGNVFQPRIENRNYGFCFDIRHHW